MSVMRSQRRFGTVVRRTVKSDRAAGAFRAIFTRVRSVRVMHACHTTTTFFFFFFLFFFLLFSILLCLILLLLLELLYLSRHLSSLALLRLASPLSLSLFFCLDSYPPPSSISSFFWRTAQGWVFLRPLLAHFLLSCFCHSFSAAAWAIKTRYCKYLV